jgi:hypothetical protein
MATNVKRKSRRLFKISDLPPETDLEYILHGYLMLDGFKPSAPDAELWAIYGKAVMQLQGQPCGNLVPWHAHKETFFDYFTRPALWWTCGEGVAEPRRLLSGDPSYAISERGYSFGLPIWFKTMGHPCVYETEKEYLIRRNLLTAAEKRLLSDEAKVE